MADIKTVTINGVTYKIEDPDALSGTDTSLSEANKAADAAAVGAALAGKAPAGFGLGNQGTLITDCNITHSGFYKFDDGTWNRPFDYGTLIVSGRHDGNCNQIAICHDGTDKGCIAVRQYGANLDDGWEFLNPRMTLNTEYRTAKRYMGKPVYTMLYDCGGTPDAVGQSKKVTPVSHPIHDLRMYYYNTYNDKGFGGDIDTFWGIRTVFDAGTVTIYRASEGFTCDHCYALIEYTK